MTKAQWFGATARVVGVVGVTIWAGISAYEEHGLFGALVFAAIAFMVSVFCIANA